MFFTVSNFVCSSNQQLFHSTVIVYEHISRAQTAARNRNKMIQLAVYRIKNTHVTEKNLTFGADTRAGN